MRRQENDIKEKVNHVLRAKGAKDHTCHWPGCFANVKPAFWGCPQHWFALPRDLRSMIWNCYVPGQETTKVVSLRYLHAAELVQIWIIATETWATYRNFAISAVNLNNPVWEFHPL